MYKIGIYIIILLFTVSVSGNAKSTFSGERLRKACIEYIESQLGPDAKIAVSEGIQLQEFDSDDITANCTYKPGSLKGNTYLTIEFSENSKIIRRINVPVRITIFAELPVALKSIRQNQVINQEDVKLENVDISGFTDSDLLDISYVVGFSAKRTISQGSVITKGLVDFGTGIKRGDKVLIMVQSGSVIVKSEGIALTDAEIGQNIRVQREKNGNTITGVAGIDKVVFISSNY